MIVSVLRNTINLLINSGNKIKEIHLSKTDYDEIKNNSAVELDKSDTMFGYPLVISDYTHIEYE